MKSKLKESRKKYNIERKRREELNNDNYVLFKKNSELQKINKVEQATRKSYEASYEMLLNTMEISSRNYCDIVIGRNNNFPFTITDIGFHKAELRKIMNILSSLIIKRDLLVVHGISEFLNNQN